MIQELVFTSARAGLQIGKSGFCTVASTPGMAENLVRLLESLSGYRHVFPAGSTSTGQNPVVYSHFTSRVGGQPLHILSRIADAGLDYSNRSNKLAHHIVIPESELADGDPIGIMREPDQFVTIWDREPEKLRPRTVDGRYLMPAPCAAWQAVTGDAGWAGALIEAFFARQIAYVIVRPTTPVLDLIGEALSLLPAEDRWRVTFSSYFTNLPPQTECLWRFVMADSPEAATAQRSPTNRVVNTTQPLAAASNRFAAAARAGDTIQASIPAAATSSLLEIDDSEPDLPLATPILSATPVSSDLRLQPPARQANTTDSRSLNSLSRPPSISLGIRRSRRRLLLTSLGVACLLCILAIGGLFVATNSDFLTKFAANGASSDRTHPNSTPPTPKSSATSASEKNIQAKHQIASPNGVDRSANNEHLTVPVLTAMPPPPHLRLPQLELNVLPSIPNSSPLGNGSIPKSPPAVESTESPLPKQLTISTVLESGADYFKICTLDGPATEPVTRPDDLIQIRSLFDSIYLVTNNDDGDGYKIAKRNGATAVAQLKWKEKSPGQWNLEFIPSDNADTKEQLPEVQKMFIKVEQNTARKADSPANVLRVFPVSPIPVTQSNIEITSPVKRSDAFINGATIFNGTTPLETSEGQEWHWVTLTKTGCINPSMRIRLQAIKNNQVETFVRLEDEHIINQTSKSVQAWDALSDWKSTLYLTADMANLVTDFSYITNHKSALKKAQNQPNDTQNLSIDNQIEILIVRVVLHRIWLRHELFILDKQIKDIDETDATENDKKLRRAHIETNRKIREQELAQFFGEPAVMIKAITKQLDDLDICGFVVDQNNQQMPVFGLVICDNARWKDPQASSALSSNARARIIDSWEQISNKLVETVDKSSGPPTADF